MLFNEPFGHQLILALTRGAVLLIAGLADPNLEDTCNVDREQNGFNVYMDIVIKRGDDVVTCVEVQTSTHS